KIEFKTELKELDLEEENEIMGQNGGKQQYSQNKNKNKRKKNQKQVSTALNKETQLFSFKNILPKWRIFGNSTRPFPLIRNREHKPALVVDGLIVSVTINSERLSNLFLLLADSCSGIVCARVAPMQKALLVRLVKLRHPAAVTLAIGDGANDVSMIQEAHVGVGIIGTEGQQAAFASDFAISRFQYLKRLMAVHGHYNLFRLAIAIKYTLYRNLVLMVPLFFFLVSSMFSLQVHYDSWFASLYNTVYVSVPIFIVNIIDRDLPDWTLESIPQIYNIFRAGKHFTVYSFVSWFIRGVYHGLCIAVSTQIFLKYGQIQAGNGTDVTQGVMAMGLYNSSMVMVLVMITVLWKSKYALRTLFLL
ncbi:MAG: putative phospholipid-transporting ATPase, partial [Streblomastix strix]